MNMTKICEHDQKYDKYRRWLLPSFLLDAFRLTGIDKPVLFRKTTNKLLKQNKKTKVKKRIQISLYPFKSDRKILAPEPRFGK